MPKYTVTTKMTVEADDEKQAAMKVFALHDTMTPEDFWISEEGVNALTGASVVFESTAPVFLEQDDKEEARRAYAAGEYFEEVDISEVKP